MLLYFVRHGESLANVARQFSNQDHEKHPLTDKGRDQARLLAERLCDVKFDAIYSSPLLRARQTAEILNAARGLEIRITPALAEHDAGNLEGRADEAAWQEYRELYDRWILKHEWDARMPNGESFAEMRARFVPFLGDLTQKYAETGANILLVGHAGLFHMMLPMLLTNVGYAFGYNHILGNTAVVVAEPKEGGLECLEWDGVKLSPTGSILE
jgi:probable phosphoglycerate mutase